MKILDKIECEGLGKRYNQEWIFRNIDATFLRGSSCAVLGHNGSGKSTFIQILSGSMMESEGSVKYYCEGKQLEQEEVYKHISYSAPYMDLIEEFSLLELVEFQNKFKGFIGGMSAMEVVERSGLKKEVNKHVKYFSSGMKQRLKLVLSILADTSILFLDEPSSNLDQSGIEWYRELIQEFKKNRILFVCSNQQAHEFDFCESKLRIEDYKKKKLFI